MNPSTCVYEWLCACESLHVFQIESWGYVWMIGKVWFFFLVALRRCDWQRFSAYALEKNWKINQHSGTRANLRHCGLFKRVSGQVPRGAATLGPILIIKYHFPLKSYSFFLMWMLIRESERFLKRESSILTASCCFQLTT